MKPEAYKNCIKPFLPAIELDEIISPARRKLVREILSTAFFALFVTVIAGKGGEEALGWFAFVLALSISAFLLEFFYNSSLSASFDQSIPSVSYPFASLMHRGLQGDLLAVFLLSPYGRWILSRCGIGTKAAEEFLAGRGSVQPSQPLIPANPADQSLDLSDIAQALVETDPSFLNWLVTGGAEKKSFIASARWCDRKEADRLARHFWWTRSNLARIPGIAKDWAYGKTPELDKYSRNFIFEVRRQGGVATVFSSKGVEELETILSRSREANALIVGEKSGGALDLLYEFARQIELGTVYPQLEHKRMLKLDLSTLITFTKEKAAFEEKILVLLSEAIRAGNIILVLESFAEAIQSAKTIGSDLTALITPFLASESLQIIAIVEPAVYHASFENDSTLSRFFEKITIREISQDSLLSALQSRVEQIERTHKLFFTYRAVEEIAVSAERYFSQGNVLDKAGDLLAELVPSVSRSGKVIVDRADVLELVERKTGIPLGEVTTREKDVLLNLETVLHQRVIGQNEAISAISNALRRSRSGVNNPNRPMGSFLFLGPTGVGKTETAKALAQLFFGTETDMLRLDMSEYRTQDALSRLIGSFGDGKPGTLTTMLRSKQYGVLLLDEFEKTQREVHDLFLQILDEGFFSDMNGKKVNARNSIIVATSNAGSSLIWESVKDQAGDATQLDTKTIESNKAKIIDAIIAQGIFKPELLNRFDGIILFQPLKPEELAKVARLILAKLNKRLEEKGISVAVTDGLVEYLVQKGTDPLFGARSMNRTIQEKIEYIVAEKLLKGEAKPGTVITIEPSDLA